jgi:Fe-S-cluster containining protein
MGEKIHPCMSCGACCAFFRVSFYYENPQMDFHSKEVSEHPEMNNYLSATENFSKWKVPIELTVTSDSKVYSMLGTEKKHRPKCTALIGRIGKLATCQIYANRPSPCRNFTASFSDGKKNPRCDEARRAHGLAPLNRGDWKLENNEDELLVIEIRT